MPGVQARDRTHSVALARSPQIRPGPQALEKLANEPGNGFLSMADGGAGRILTWNLNEGLAQVDDAMDGRDVHKACDRRYHSMNFRKPDWIRVAGL